MTITPDTIQDLVTIAFVREPLAEKPGCTTRTVDLPNKPLTDFLVAGINVGKYFRFLVNDIQKDSETPIFKYYVQALQNANAHKSPKTVNFGLLEIMFPAVCARLACDNKEGVVDAMIEFMKKESQEDVQYLCDARMEAWKTSTTAHKQEFEAGDFNSTTSSWDFYMALHAAYPRDNSSNQWAQEYMDGLPTIRAMLSVLENQSVEDASVSVYTQTIAQQPDIKKGLVADMCAAGIFLHLSFQD